MRISDWSSDVCSSDLNEVGARNGEERHARFTRNGAGEQRFASTGRTHQQRTLGNLAAKARELRRVFQELNDFLQFLTRFINTCDVVKSYFALLFGKQFRLGFTKAHGARSRTLLHLPQHEEGEIGRAHV